MISKKLTLLGASIFLSFGLLTSSYANWNWNTHRVWTKCYNGVCHRYANTYTKHCGWGGCRVWKTHYHWVWRR
ncbi:hypothetical protein [Legionella gresilensis]|uniref:hypothetical protein n=1 Tax=Legionella gresilensis TaxID=91823 RepID=UPI001041803F|nr:hypothetical protein [Legionella gresilensis]